MENIKNLKFFWKLVKLCILENIIKFGNNNEM